MILTDPCRASRLPETQIWICTYIIFQIPPTGIYLQVGPVIECQSSANPIPGPDEHTGSSLSLFSSPPAQHLLSSSSEIRYHSGLFAAGSDQTTS